jgi:tRNA(Ile)-lysidine synthase TilS/MesJ
MFVIQFEAETRKQDIKVHHFPKATYEISEVISMAEYFAGGGTLFEPALDLAKDKINEAKEFSKADIINICDQTKLPYFIDPCNNDIKYTRNFWRKEIIPKLKDHYSESGLFKKINTISKIYEV